MGIFSKKAVADDIINSNDFFEDEKTIASRNAEMVKFTNDPLDYMRRNAVIPSSTAGGTGDIEGTSTVLDRFIRADTKVLVPTETVTLFKSRDNVSFMSLEAKNGVVNLGLKQMPGPGLEPVHFLPWASHALVRLKIPAMPAGTGAVSLNKHPRFFFTSALSGCTLFFKGDQFSPEVFHAGVSDAIITGDSDRFWREQLLALNAGCAKRDLKAQLKKTDYLGTDRRQVDRYLAWIDAPTSNDLWLDVVECTACVFGLRKAKKWTFYVQEQLNSSVVRIVDRSKVQSSIQPNGKVYNSVDSGARAELVMRLKTYKHHVGPFRFGAKVSKTFQVTEVAQKTPIGIREIFPRTDHKLVDQKFLVKARVA